MKESLHFGCPIMVGRGLYWHHGLYVGHGQVIHYSGPNNSKFNATVRYTTLHQFADGKQVVINTALAKLASYHPHEVVARAQRRLGERSFNLLTNNCEHFVSWCVKGSNESAQIQSATKVASTALMFAFVIALFRA